MRITTLICFLLPAMIVAMPVFLHAEDGAAEHFERFVRPIFEDHCVECHNSDEAELGVRFDEPEAFFAGGETGALVVAGDPKASRFLQLVTGRADKQMPPDYRLEPEQIAALEKWVTDGPVWPGYDGVARNSSPQTATKVAFTDDQLSYWAFQPITDPSPPAVDETGWALNEIDHFVLDKLKKAELQPAAPATRKKLIRRVTYDLTGLPPTTEEIEAFVNDDSPDAYEKLVERLLKSHHYGEHWGRHWLDVVRFAESAAHDGNNAYLHAWRYRDYVIDAFNQDKPYDKFVVEQIAGDLLPKTENPRQNYDQVVATGFLQVGTKPVVMRDKRQMLLDIADEQLHTTGVTFLGLSIGCARCHDHKFDPIPTADYYSFAGIFLSTHIMSDSAPDSKWLEYDVENADGQKVTVMAVKDHAEPKNERIHLRGNRHTLGPEVPRRFLQIIAGVDHEAIKTNGSGRLELAQWIGSAHHPLTARVMVNRIWQYHLGRGLVASSGDFGIRGEPPTHPELLDYLASRFIQSGWSVKAIHRLILQSATYRQSHGENESAALVDAENRLLWRFPLRRLVAEEIRDSLLTVSGRMDDRVGGTFFTMGFAPVDAARKLYTVDISKGGAERMFANSVRSVYLPVIRNGRPETLVAFDVPNAHESTLVRSETTVAPQALFMLNGPFVREQANFLAEEFLGRESLSDHELVDRAHVRIFGRRADPDELESGSRFASQYRAAIVDDPSLIDSIQDPMELADNLEYATLIRDHPKLLEYVNSNSIRFDGESTRLDVGAPATLNQGQESVSFEAWIQPDPPLVEGKSSLVIGRDGADSRLWKCGLTARRQGEVLNNVLFYEVFNPGPNGGLVYLESPEGTVPTDRLTHIVVTFGDGFRQLYVNGQLSHRAKWDGQPGSATTPLSIGGRPDDSEWFAGKIQDVAVYSSALDESTIRDHYRARAPNQRTPEEEIDVATWRAYIQTLLCSNEFLYVE